ncbi:MAG: S8 family serine peptidase [Nitrospiraceae bacterium]|nr:S8 family serine peptidase [Nitrospiraceae bacterium]
MAYLLVNDLIFFWARMLLSVLLIMSSSCCGCVSQCLAQDTAKILVILKPSAVIRPIPKGIISLRRIPKSPIVCIKVSKDHAEEVIRKLRAQKGIRSIELSGRGSIENNSSLEGVRDSDWYRYIKGKEAKRLSGGTGIIVAVIDSGIDFQDTSLSSHVSVNTAESPGDLIDNDKNGYIDDRTGWDFGSMDNDPQDENGHGTEVSSIILSLSPRCKILPIKINQGGEDSFSTAALVAGIYYAAVSLKARVINLSLVVDQDSPAVAEAIRAAYAAGAIIVGAAGNDHGPVKFPGSMSEVIAVGGLSDDSPAWFSPEGPQIEIMAPAVAVKCITLGSTVNYASGTSFSCAMVSGTSADLLGMNPHLGNKTARLLLDSGVRDLGDPGRDYIFGEGALDGKILAEAAIPSFAFPKGHFAAFSKSVPIQVSFHLPPTDTPSCVYIGVLSPDNTLWWLDGHGDWHDSQQDPLSPIATLGPYSSPIDGMLFGKEGAFPALTTSSIPSGLYLWGVAVVDGSGRSLAPFTWDHMFLF